MKTARIIYIAAWIIPITLATLYLTGVISDTRASADPIATYILSLSCIVLTLTTSYLSLRLFHFAPIRKHLCLDASNEAYSKETRPNCVSYSHLCIAREMAIAIVCVLDLAAYYLLHTQSPLYLAGIMLVSLLFCFPNNN